MVRIFHCILSSLCSIFTPSTRPTKGAHALHAERQGSVSRPRLAARPLSDWAPRSLGAVPRAGLRGPVCVSCARATRATGTRCVSRSDSTWPAAASRRLGLGLGSLWLTHSARLESGQSRTRYARLRSTWRSGRPRQQGQGSEGQVLDMALGTHGSRGKGGRRPAATGRYRPLRTALLAAALPEYETRSKHSGRCEERLVE